MRVVSGGMILKLEAAKRAIEGGVREVRIVGAPLRTPCYWLPMRRPPSSDSVPFISWNARPP